ncbi:MAG: hypothetical protein V1737_01135 [Chloroflexota bacterium]
MEEGKLARPVILARVIHGFTFFMIVIEGGTAPLCVTFAALATLVFAGRGAYWHGLPQLSELGCIQETLLAVSA